MKLVGGDVTQSSVTVIRAVVVPASKAKFVEATLDVPLVEGKTVIFEPAVKSLSTQGVVAPESLLTLTSDKSVLIPVENYHSMLGANLVLGNVVRQSEEAKVPCNTFGDLVS